MMNENINMVELNDVALENVVGGLTVVDNINGEDLDKSIRKIPFIGPLYVNIRKIFGF